MASIKIFALGGLDQKSNDLTRSVEKASDMLNLEYDTQSTLKKRNGFEVFSTEDSKDMIYYNSKEEFLLFNESTNVTILDKTGAVKTYNGTNYYPLPYGVSALSNVSVSSCENSNNLYFTNTDYNTYVMKYDGGSIYRAGLLTPRNSGANGADIYPSYSASTDGNTRIFYSFKDLNGNIIYSPYVQLDKFPTATANLLISSFKPDINCRENGFYNKYCYVTKTGATRFTATTGVLSYSSLTDKWKLTVNTSDVTFGSLFVGDFISFSGVIGKPRITQINDIITAKEYILDTAQQTPGTVTSIISKNAISSSVYTIAVTKHNYVPGDKFLIDSENQLITISDNKTFIILDVFAVTPTSITFTYQSVGTTNIAFEDGSSLYSTEYPIDIRSKVHIAQSSSADTGYTVTKIKCIDNSTVLNTINLTNPTEGVLVGTNGLRDVAFEDVYDSTTLKIMPPICKYISSFGDQIVYGSIRSVFTGFGSTVEAPNRRNEYTNDDFIIYSDVSTGDGPENTSPLNIQKIGETWDGYITGMRRCNDSLVIFKNRGVFSIDGALISGEYQLRKINTNSAGCTSHKSILESEEGLYFQAHNGIYYTNAIGIKKLTYEIDSVFGSANYTTTRSVRLKKKQKSLFYIPELSKIVVIDYYYNQVYFWNNITASNGFVEDSLGNVYFCTGTNIYKFNDSYSDAGNAINAYYSTTWHHAGEPSLNKKWLSLRLFALTDDVHNVTISTDGDWDIHSPLTSNQLSFTVNDQTKFLMFDMKTKRSFRLTFSNNLLNENLPITGYELNYEIFNNVDKN